MKLSEVRAITRTQTVDTNAQFLALLDAAVDAIIVIDHQGLIEVFNNAAQKMFGYQAAQVLGKNVSMLMPNPYKAEHDQYIQNYIHSKHANIIGIGREVKATKANGDIFPIELSVGEVELANPPQFVGIIRDISDRIQTQADLAESRERLAQMTRLNTMGEMTAGIAHEVNQPLTAITSYAQACRNFLAQLQTSSQDESLQKVKTTLDKISAQTHRASEVILRLRNFVKKGQVTRAEVNLNTLIRNTIELAQVDTKLLEHGIQLSLIDEPQPILEVDHVQIQQVLFNLIHNAMDAMDTSQSRSRSAKTHPIQISAKWLDKHTIQVSVADNGHGVDSAQVDLLFLPFFTTKSSGMGVGLSICQTIIEAHGGKLEYSNGRPKGSIFTFTLPASHNAQPVSI